MQRPSSDRAGERGTALGLVVALLLPLLVMVGASVSLMTGRSSRLMSEVSLAKALSAAESGVDESIYKAMNGTLVSGSTFTRDLGSGLKYSVQPTNLQLDGTDNDGNGMIDDAAENSFKLVVTGQFTRTSKRLAAFLGASSALPLESALTVLGTEFGVTMSGFARISGIDTRISGVPGDPAKNVMGVAVHSPATVAGMVAALNMGALATITGTGPSPNFQPAVLQTAKVTSMLAQFRSNATVLVSGSYSNQNWGTASSPVVLYRNGNLAVSNGGGHGVLIVDGTLSVSGVQEWVGLVYCKRFAGTGGCRFLGAVVVEGGDAVLSGTDSFLWSVDALNLVDWSAGGVSYDPTGGGYQRIIGWQELAR